MKWMGRGVLPSAGMTAAFGHTLLLRHCANGPAQNAAPDEGESPRVEMTGSATKQSSFLLRHDGLLCWRSQ